MGLRQAHDLSERLDIDGSGPNCECSRMYASCVLIGPAALRRMYVEELRTTDQIAAHFGCSGTTVRRHLRRFKIPVRPRGPCGGRLRPRHGFAPTLPRWSADVAYVVGLIATDGNLGRKKTGYHTRVQGHRSARNGPTLPRFDRTDQIA